MYYPPISWHTLLIFTIYLVQYLLPPVALFCIFAFDLIGESG